MLAYRVEARISRRRDAEDVRGMASVTTGNQRGAWCNCEDERKEEGEVMPVVHLIKDSWYPVYSVVGDDLREISNIAIELTGEELEFVTKAEADFRKSQELIDVKLLTKAPPHPCTR